VTYGAELVTNGTFDTDTNWTKTSTVTISGGVANIVSDGSYQYLLQPSVLEVGKVYEVRYDITSSVSGSLKASTSFNISGGIESTVGSHSFVGTAKATSFYIERNSACDISIDNISVKEVTFDQADGTLTLFNHPNNIPRIDYDSDGNRLGLLIEESRTNLVTYSERLSQQNDIRCTVTDNQAISPSGNTDASSAIESTDSADHRIDFISISVTSGTSYTFSVYIKEAGRSWVRIQMGTGGFGTAYANFNLSTGAIGTTTGITTAQTTDLGNGWYRCEITATATATASTTLAVQLGTGDQGISYTGDGTSGIYIYGAQLEAGSFPTSYIPTSGATATRSADVASISTDAFGYNQSAGSVVVQIGKHAGVTSGSQYVVSLDNNASGERMQINRFNGNYILDVVDGGVSQVSVSVGPGADNSKIAFAYALNNFAATEDGDTPVTDTSGTVPAPTEVTIGTAWNGGSPLNGHIKSIRYYPRRLTNAQLQEITT